MYFKRLLFSIIAFVLISDSCVWAQINSDFVNNKCVKKDNIIVDAFYGWPYFNGLILQGLANANNITNVKNTNHLGGKIEYMLNEKMGIGGEFTYADAGINYVSGVNGQLYKAGVNKIRILGRFNYHFGITQKIDPYFTFGLGYKRTYFYDTGTSGANQSFNLLPVAFKTAIGMRVYFNDLIGINGEVGFGGPLIAAGLSLKI
jgi:hypothetical protein